MSAYTSKTKRGDRQELKRRLERNLVLFPWYYGLQMLSFFAPIIVLFFLANRISYTQIFILEAFYGLAIVLCELPTGMLADKYGRKKSLVISGVLLLAGVAVFAQGKGFVDFLIAELLWGIGSSFRSGAEEAMLFDTLKDLRRSTEYKKIMSKAVSVFYGCGVVSAITGGIIAQHGLRLPFYVACVTYSVMLLLTFLLQEPSYHKSTTGHIAHILAAIQEAWNKRKIRWLICYQATLVCALLILFWMIQPYLQLVKVPVSLFGVFFAGYYLLGLFASRYAHTIERIIGIRKSLFVMGITLMLGFFMLGLIPAVISTIWIFLMEMVWGYSIPLMSDYLNRLVASHQRATILSVGSFLTRLLFAILGPLFGKIADTQGIAFTLMVIAGAFFVPFVTLWITFNSHNDMKT